MEEIGSAKASINRSKGLGENDPEMMWLTTMNPATRRLIRVMPEDAERTAEMFDLLLGDDLAGRKKHISEFAASTWTWPTYPEGESKWTSRQPARW